MSEPIVINLKGTQKKYGCELENDINLVYAGCACFMGGWKLRDSKWKNPYKVIQYGRDECLKLYKQYLIYLYLNVSNKFVRILFMFLVSQFSIHECLRIVCVLR